MKHAFLALMLFACGGSSTADDKPGDDDPTGTDPQIVAGGGATGAEINGQLHVYAIDSASGEPLNGAAVRVETATPLTGTTDATGLVTFTDASLAGPQTVTVTASGHAAVTWVGVKDVNVTLPVQSSSAPATAHAKGTISGLPQPGFGDSTHYTLAVVLYSFLDDPSAPENSIAQPTNSDGTPKNACVITSISSSSSCDWELTARTGKQVHTAVVLQGNTHNTPNDTSDDTYTLYGYYASAPVTLTAGQQVNDEHLTQVASTSMLTITLPSPPAGLSHISAIPELALGDAGRIVFPLPAQSTSGPHTVIAPSGAFAGHYEVVAVAAPNATAATPFSTSFAHDATDSATVPAFLPAPGTPSGSGGAYTFTAAAGASFHTAQFTRGTTILWNVTLLDGTSSFTLPPISPSPLGSGAAKLAVSGASSLDFDAGHFKLPEVTAGLAGASGATATVTP